jgi:hypothetical protein
MTRSPGGTHQAARPRTVSPTTIHPIAQGAPDMPSTPRHPLTFAPAALAALALSACGGGGDEAATAPAAAASNAYVGFFYNTTVSAGGILQATLSASSSRVEGSWNFTEDEAEQITLCAAGTGAFSRTGNNYQGSFTSNDPDPGCSFDAGRPFSMAGSMDASGAHHWGSYGASSQDGVYDLWKDGVLTLRTCPGTLNIPASGSAPATTVAAALASYVGEKTVYGILAAQNFDITTRAPLANCISTGTLIGSRDASSNASSMKLIWTERSGTGCATKTASGTALLTGTVSDSAMSGTERSTGASFSVGSCTTSTVSALGGADGARASATQAARLWRGPAR